MRLIVRKEKRANSKSCTLYLTPKKKMEMVYKRSKFPNSHHWRYEQRDQRRHEQEGDQVRGVYLMKRFTCISQNTAYPPDSTKLNKGLNLTVAKQRWCTWLRVALSFNVGGLFYSFPELETKLNDYKLVNCVEFWNETPELLWLQRKGWKKN